MKELLKKKVGNYQIKSAPHQKEFQSQDCFSASIATVVKQGEGADAIYYQITFAFDYAPGKINCIIEHLETILKSIA